MGKEAFVATAGRWGGGGGLCSVAYMAWFSVSRPYVHGCMKKVI
jgi:hypothetical protein